MSLVKHLVFIDEELLNFDSILSNLPEGSDWFKVENSKDGILQIEEISKSYENLDSIQLVTHGSPGLLNIGSASLSSSNLADYQTNLDAIGTSLSPSGDILIYGCNIASNESGQSFIEGIAEYTLADIAASTDLTGPSTLGGDSDLEFQTGTITTTPISVEGLGENLAWTDGQIDSDLLWPDLKALMKQYNDDNSYSYLEMRTLLETAATGGLHSYEFNDLKTIYTKIESEFEKDPGSTDSYVQYITYGAIYPHAANAKWTGGVTKVGEIQNLGNMKANMSEAKVTKLIKKWFYGEDLPMPIAGGDTANPDASAKVGKYYASTGDMFKADVNLATDTSSTTSGVLVTADDMAQGQAGTCWILACLGAVAHAGDGTSNAGKAIEGLIIDPIADDQIWGMKFYNNNKEAVYVTVNSEIPVSTSDNWWQINNPLFALNAEAYTINNGDPDGVSNGDNLSAAGNLTIDGALGSSGTATMPGNYKQLAITSTGNDSGVTFTVTGTNYWNEAQTDTITGANAGVANGTKYFKTITQIAADGATAGNVISGNKASQTSNKEKDPDGELWSGLFEKGYAQANSYIANRADGQNSYLAMEGGSALGFKHLTGKDYQWYHGSADMYKYSNVEKATTQVISEALAAGAVGYVGGRKASTDPVTGKKQMVKGHAHMLLEYDSTTNEFLIRNPWGGENSASRDMEWWAPLSEITSASNPNSIFLTDTITMPKSYSYTVVSDAATSGAAVFEGKSITFTVTRNDVGDETTVYLSTVSGTADGNDYKEYAKSQLKFGKQETSKTFVVETFNDALTEGSSGVDNFSLGLFLKSTQASATVTGAAYLKDKAPTDYNYSISSNAATADDALTEGGAIAFTISRSKVTSSDSDSESTVYLNTSGSTASDQDFDALSNRKVEFKAFQNSKKIFINTTKDTSDEGKESFSLNLYKDLTASNAAGTPVATAAGYIDDEWAPSYDYAITSNSGTSSDAKAEGKVVTFTVTRSGSGTESKVYVSTTDKSAIAGDDFDGFSDKALTFKANQKKLTVEVQTKMDVWLETTEFFELSLYTNTNTKAILSSGSAFLSDAEYKSDYYSIVNTSIEGGDPDGISTSQDLNDPNGISTAATISGSGNLTINGALGNSTSVLGGKVVTILSAADDSSAKFTVTGTNMSDEALSEVIWGVNASTAIGKKVFKTVTQIAVDKATAGNVSAGVSGGDLTINGAFNGGGTATLNGKFVSITSVGNDSSVKFTITGTDADDATLSETIFGATAQTVTGTKLFKTVTKITADKATSGNITAGTIGNGTDEGENITFTITRTNVNNAADSIYLSTAAGTAKDSDFDGFTGQELKFAEFETTKTVKVKAVSDSVNDDNEYFWLNMYLNKTALANDETMVSNKAYIDHVAVPTAHAYTITNNSPSNNASTVSEGGAITFTIARETTGSAEASTIYVSTAAGTGDKDDFKAIDKVAINFGTKEKLKTVTVNSKSDSISESEEDFYLLVYKSEDDAQNGDNAQYNKAYIKNLDTVSYSYVIDSDTGYSTPVEEGGDITFTVTRSAVGSASTVYVSATQGSASTDDYKAVDKEALSFAAHEQTKTIKVSTVSDTLVEEKEYFWFDLYKTLEDAESGAYNAYSAGYITDAIGTAAEDYTYAITSVNDTENSGTAVTEGQEATFTITRTLGSGKTASASTVYVSTADGTAGSEDYQALNKFSVDFKSNELTKEVTVQTDSDSVTDDGEYFFLNVFKSAVDADDGNHAGWSKAFIANDATAVTTAAAYNYAVNSSNNIDDGSGETAVTEGKDITFTITRSREDGATIGNSDVAATVYVSTSEGSAHNEDFQGLEQVAVEFKKDETVKTVTVSTVVDTITEATGSSAEYFWLDLYKTKADADSFSYHSYAKGHITDDTSLADALAAYSYTVSGANNSSSTAVTEGGDATFTITRSKDDASASDASTTVYVSTTQATAYEEDYVSLNLKEVEFKLGETTKVVTVKTKADSITDDDEYFWLDVFETKADSENSIFAAYDKGYISNDSGSVTASANYSYTVSGANNSADKAVTEGEAVTFTITRTNSGGGADTSSIVYMSTSEGTASSNDFEIITNKAIEFKANETSKTVTVGTKKDAETDNSEFFWLDIYKSLSDAENNDYYVWDQGYINDDTSAADSLNNYTYAITSINDTGNSGSAVEEGGTAVFTITRTKTTGSDVAATVYVSTGTGTAGEDDYQSASKLAVEFKANETVKNISIQTKEDSITDDGEYFSLELFKTEADLEAGNYNTYGKAFIADNAAAANAVNDYTYTVTGDNNTSEKAASEGSDITFTISRVLGGTNTAAAATVYLNTTHSTTDTDDIVSLDKYALDFKADELTKTLVITTNTDGFTEGNEYFWLDLFKTKADVENNNYHAWDEGYLKDNSTAASANTKYNYTISNPYSNDIEPLTEGGTVTFTITKIKVAGGAFGSSDVASTVYVGTQDSSATGSDYKAMAPTELTFMPKEASKTVTVQTYGDEDVESTAESFYLGLFKTKAQLNSYLENGDESSLDAYSAAYIGDPSAVSGVGTFSYTVTTDSTSDSAVSEGSDITVTVTRNISGGAAGDSKVYMNTTDGSADTTDFVTQKATEVAFTSSDADGATKTVTVSTRTDALSESKESFYIDLFKTLGDAEQGSYFSYATAYIANAAAPAAATTTYAISNNSGSGDPQEESGTVTFTITDGSATSASTVWVSTVDGTAFSGEDYTGLYYKKVEFGTSDTSKTVTVSLLGDSVVDADETFYLELYKSEQDAFSGTEAVDSKAFIENTTVIDNFTYSVVSTNTTSNPVTEGSAATFTVTRSGSVGATTVFMSSSAGSADTNDFTKITAVPLTFENGQTEKTITVDTTTDSSSEGKEYFWFDVYKDKAYAETDYWAGSSGFKNAYIVDPASGSLLPSEVSLDSSESFTYTILNTNSIIGVSGKVIEGDNATFDITRSGKGSETTIYVSTYVTDDIGYATTEDFNFLDHFAVTFGVDELVKQVSVNTIRDENEEGNELFYLRMNKNATSDTYEFGSLDSVVITEATGTLGALALGSNSGNVAGTDTVTVTSASKNSFPGHKAGQFFNDFAFSATTSSGSVVSWGNSTKGGDTVAVSSHLTNVSKLFSNVTSFAAVKNDGSVITWGDVDAGGTSWDLDGLSEVATITGAGNLTLGGAATSSGAATFTKLEKVTITSAGNDSGVTFTVTGTDTNGTSQTETITGSNAGTSEGTTLFKTVTQIAVDAATAGNVSAGNLYSLTYAIASDLNGTTDVVKISSTANAFAAVRSDGSVVTWGSKGTGGDSRSVSSSLDGTVNVREVYSNMSAFAALREDGSVITWGYSSFGGDSSSVSSKITDTTASSTFVQVNDISATGSAFAAIRADGSVVTWGNSQDGGDSSSIASSIDGDTDPTDVVQVYSTTSAFAALQKNGAVITWGDVNNGGSKADVSSSLNGATDVTKIWSTNTAFAALRSDGSVITWGDGTNGGNSSSVSADLDGGSDEAEDITNVFNTSSAFAALRADNKVITWGYGSYGGDSSSVSSIINGTLDADSVSVSASVSAGANFVLGGDQTGSGTATFANSERITITSAGDDSARTFTITGTNSVGGAQTETITGANAGAATGAQYFKTVTQISVDGGGNTASSVTAGVINKEVKTIVATDKSFAALLKDGSVISWGDGTAGGDSSAVSDKLVMGSSNSSAVTQLYASSGAFSAIKADGSVVTWGDTDKGGSSTSVDFSSSTISGMSGASSGVECNIKHWKQHNSADVSVNSTTLTLMTTESTPQQVSGSFATDGGGTIDLSAVSDGNYTGSYVVTNSTHLTQSIDIYDCLAILDYTTGALTPTSSQLISGNVREDANLNVYDFLDALDMSTGAITAGKTILRDASASSATYDSSTSSITNSSNVFAIQSGTNLDLHCYLLGDVDGDYAGQIA